MSLTINFTGQNVQWKRLVSFWFPNDPAYYSLLDTVEGAVYGATSIGTNRAPVFDDYECTDTDRIVWLQVTLFDDPTSSYAESFANDKMAFTYERAYNFDETKGMSVVFPVYFISTTAGRANVTSNIQLPYGAEILGSQEQQLIFSYSHSSYGGDGALFTPEIITDKNIEIYRRAITIAGEYYPGDNQLIYPNDENVLIRNPQYGSHKLTTDSNNANEYYETFWIKNNESIPYSFSIKELWHIPAVTVNPGETKLFVNLEQDNERVIVGFKTETTPYTIIAEPVTVKSRLYLRNATMRIDLLDQDSLDIFIIEKEKTIQVDHFDTEDNCAIFCCENIVEPGTYKCAIHWKPTDIHDFIEGGINVLYRPTNYWEQMDPYNNIHTTYQYITFETDGTDVYFEDSLFNDTTRKNDIPEPSDQVYELIGKTSDYIICQNNCSVRARIQYNGSNIGDPFTLENNINYSVPNENYIQGQYTVIFEAYNSNSNIACLATSSINDTKTIIERSSWQAVDSAIHTNSSFLSPVITTSTENVYRITTRDLALAEEAYGIHDYFNPDYTNGTMTYYNIIDQTVWEDKILFVWYSSYRYLRLNNAKPSERQDYNHQIVSNDKNNFGISIKITNSDNWNNLITKYHLAAPLSNVTSSLPEWCINDDTIYIPAAADPNTDYIAFAFTGYNSSTPSIVPGYSYYGGNSKLNDKYVIEPCYELKTDLVSTVGLSAVGTNLSGKKDIYMSAGRDNLYRFENNLHSGPSKYITVYKNGVQVGRYVCAAWRYTTFRVANVFPGDLVEIKSDPEDSKPKINVGGVWKDSDGYIFIDGTWKKINKAYIYKDSAWKECN